MRPTPAILILLGGCTPLTAYRQTTFVPASAPPLHIGAPIGAGTVAGGVSVSGYAVTDPVDAALTATDPNSAIDAVSRFFPVEGDPGLAHPTMSVQADGRIGISELLELGAHGAYSGSEWTGRNFGVLELPEDQPLYGIGAHVTVGKTWGKVGLGGTVDATAWSLPYARWVYAGPEEYAGGYAIGDAAEWYDLEKQGRVGVLVVSAAIATSFRIGPLDSAAGFAFVPNVSNRGFTDEPAPPAEWHGLSVVPTLDVGLLFAPVRFGVQGWYASGASAASNRLTNGLGIRGQIELRGKLRKEPKPEVPPAASP